MKVEINNETKEITVTADTRDEGDFLSNSGGVDLLNKFEVPVGSTLVIKETKWNCHDKLTRLSENSYT